MWDAEAPGAQGGWTTEASLLWPGRIDVVVRTAGKLLSRTVEQTASPANSREGSMRSRIPVNRCVKIRERRRGRIEQPTAWSAASHTMRRR
jgi:hypothetical protein